MVDPPRCRCPLHAVPVQRTFVVHPSPCRWHGRPGDEVPRRPTRILRMSSPEGRVDRTVGQTGPWACSTPTHSPYCPAALPDGRAPGVGHPMHCIEPAAWHGRFPARDRQYRVDACLGHAEGLGAPLVALQPKPRSQGGDGLHTARASRIRSARHGRELSTPTLQGPLPLLAPWSTWLPWKPQAGTRSAWRDRPDPVSGNWCRYKPNRPSGYPLGGRSAFRAQLPDAEDRRVHQSGDTPFESARGPQLRFRITPPLSGSCHSPGAAGERGPQHLSRGGGAPVSRLEDPDARPSGSLSGHARRPHPSGPPHSFLPTGAAGPVATSRLPGDDARRGDPSSPGGRVACGPANGWVRTAAGVRPGVQGDDTRPLTDGAMWPPPCGA